MSPAVAPLAGGNGRPPWAQLGFQARLTTTLVVRQFALLFAIATLLLVTTFFFNYQRVLNFDRLWEPIIVYKAIEVHALLVLIYGYVILIGVLFALTPSERSFQLFFFGIFSALFLVNYDHSVLDWFVRALAGADLTAPNSVSAFKMAAIGPLLSCVILMHYNILADDFMRRMIRRGIPTEEALKIRPGMFKVLVPLLLASCAIGVGFALVGEFSELIFQGHQLFPKAEILIMGVLGVAIAFLLRSIIRELWTGDETEADEPNAEDVRERV